MLLPMYSRLFCFVNMLRPVTGAVLYGRNAFWNGRLSVLFDGSYDLGRKMLRTYEHRKGHTRRHTLGAVFSGVKPWRIIATL